MMIWYAQEHPTSCVAACIRIVMSSFSLTCAEMQIRLIIGNPKLGISLVTTSAHLNQQGATSYAYDDWSLDDIRDAIRDGRFPIVGVERHWLGYAPASHAVVVVNVTSTGVEILDPLDGPQPKQFGVSAFQQAWHFAGQEVLILESPPPINE
ncbi:MAG TPA: cysteine peptidase family C39 domain-containing protein [Blastocatellia bacterium]|nr:cysteine peptidase family C39 domain-containing protein [Blastocatellia bacterium]